MKQENTYNKLSDFPKYFNEGSDIFKFGIGGQYKYFQGDSEEFYLKNLKTMPEDWYYRTNDITYDVNSYGFRTRDFNEINWQDSYVMFGCSFVFGTGVEESKTIPSFLSEYLGKEVINLGISAASNELIFYALTMFKKKYGIPLGVIVLWSSIERSTFFIYNGISSLGPWSVREDVYSKKVDRKLYECLQSEWVNGFMKSHYLSLAATEMWKNECKFFSTTSFNDTIFSKHILLYDQKGRDLSHCGNETNKLNAELIFNELKTI